MTNPRPYAAVALATVMAGAPTGLLASGYLGGGPGYFRLNDDFFLERDESFKDDRFAWKVHAGLQPHRVLSLEGGYIDFGSPRDGGLTMEIDGWRVSALGHLPIAENFSPYGQIGMLFWDRTRSTEFAEESDTGQDMFFGVGTRFDLSEVLQLRIEYERYGVDETDLDMGSISLQFRF